MLSTRREREVNVHSFHRLEQGILIQCEKLYGACAAWSYVASICSMQQSAGLFFLSETMSKEIVLLVASAAIGK